MHYLQYILDDPDKKYPVIAHYPRIAKEEILLRFACDYWVKDHKVYEQTSTEIDGMIYSIYVQHNPEEQVVEKGIIFEPKWQGVKLEFRHFHPNWTQYPIVQEQKHSSAQDVLLSLLAELHLIQGRFWQKQSTEVDENQKKYVIYVTPYEG
ncbi:hypothetical protein [Thermoactinomyces sp. DSM 45892]|nr:hypothetical protein [Thermoactinomyces sp. DSM 45892]SDZ20541.1 hypothetical protein SAMN05444416_11622 [Thermoactinomyces sp. DSM 45892]